jgi:hypothetical protein
MQKSQDLAVVVYTKDYGFRNQICDASVILQKDLTEVLKQIFVDFYI